MKPGAHRFGQSGRKEIRQGPGGNRGGQLGKTVNIKVPGDMLLFHQWIKKRPRGPHHRQYLLPSTSPRTRTFPWSGTDFPSTTAWGTPTSPPWATGAPLRLMEQTPGRPPGSPGQGRRRTSRWNWLCSVRGRRWKLEGRKSPMRCKRGSPSSSSSLWAFTFHFHPFAF